MIGLTEIIAIFRPCRIIGDHQDANDPELMPLDEVIADSDLLILAGRALSAGPPFNCRPVFVIIRFGP